MPMFLPAAGFGINMFHPIMAGSILDTDLFRRGLALLLETTLIMTLSRRCLLPLLVGLLGPVSCLLASGPDSSGALVRLTPERIEKHTLFGGVQVRIEGTALPDTKVIVVVRGMDVEEAFNRKGRVGPIWVNVAKLRVYAIPSLFLCFSPEPVAALLKPEYIDKYQLDEAAIKRQMRINPKLTSPSDTPPSTASSVSSSPPSPASASTSWSPGSPRNVSLPTDSARLGLCGPVLH